jgi:hypothetical protein
MIIIWFEPEHIALQRLDRHPVLIGDYQSNRKIYHPDIDPASLPASIVASLFEGVSISATRDEVAMLQKSGVRRLYKAKRDQTAAVFEAAARRSSKAP